MTDFFGSVRNIELVRSNDTAFSGFEMDGESEPVSTSQTCQTSLPLSVPPASLVSMKPSNTIARLNVADM